MKKKILLFQITFLAIACLVIEVVLRLLGYPPGDLRPNWLSFQPVDSLYVIPDYYTNQHGLLVASDTFWEGRDIAINSEGFRGKDYSQLDSTKKKVLFIGDSFTWGMSANPFFDSSFCDILARETNFEIINTGIPAADPPQYAKVAELYVPRLRPDFVFVVFFMGNDLMKEDRIVTANKPFYYWTNAGAILADIDGKHFNSAQESYNYLSNERYFLKYPVKWYEKVIAQSSLLSRLYAGTYRIKEKIAYEKLRKKTGLTRKYLSAIKETCATQNVPVRFVLIPEQKEADVSIERYRTKYADLLKGNQLEGDWLLWPCSKDYFRPNPDGHLDNQGHRVYADSIKNYLKAYFSEHN